MLLGIQGLNTNLVKSNNDEEFSWREILSHYYVITDAFFLPFPPAAVVWSGNSFQNYSGRREPPLPSAMEYH